VLLRQSQREPATDPAELDPGRGRQQNPRPSRQAGSGRAGADPVPRLWCACFLPIHEVIVVAVVLTRKEVRASQGPKVQAGRQQVVMREVVVRAW